MKLSSSKKLLIIGLVTMFSQFSLADNASATKEIAAILSSFSHFPSDADKATLAAIAADSETGRGFQMVATAVADISHSATSEGKAAMAQIMASERASMDAKALAEIVAAINHVPSADAKATLATMM